MNLKIKDIVFKTVDGGKQYAEVLVNGKTGSRHNTVNPVNTLH
ncbi:MAG: hypothetical protein ACJ71K_16580 [Nitrososphaeraceae archaeon]